jgi:hypothetical protein
MFLSKCNAAFLRRAVVVVTLALAGIVLRAQAPSPQTSVAGTPWTGSAGVRETTAHIMARDQLWATQPKGRHVAPRFVLPPASGARSTSPAAPALAPAAASLLNAQTVSPTLNFTAATYYDCSGWPPDTMGAVGPTQFVIALNGRVRSFNKATGLADNGINTGTDSFFSSVMTPGSNFTTDPRIRYDRLSGRWFITMIDVPGQQATKPNRVMIAMSDSDTITGSMTWTLFQFGGDPSNFADYPTLGIDANALYIGANIFSTSSGSFINTTAFVVRKSSLLSGGPIVVTPFTGLITTSGHPPRSSGPFTPQGVDNYDSSATEGYFIGVDISSSSTLRLRRVSNPGGTPSLSGNVNIGVSSFAAPINVTVLGTSGTVDGLDDRLLAAHYRNGSLWTSHTVGVNSSGGTSGPDRNGVRWYQIKGIATGQTPSVAQSGTVYQSGSASVSYWMGTIMVSGQGHAAMGFTKAGPNSFLDAATTGRLIGDASGTMGTPVTYTTSTSAYNPSDGSTPHRWGDYSYTSLDPSDDLTMWTIQEWCQSSGNGYAVQVVKLLAPPPALPTNCTPSSVTQGVANVSVVIRASATNGTGFFDPGTNFPNRPSATVNGGGVTVNSVTYNNPTNLTLNLTVAPSAAAGVRTVTITNPDGQSTTSASGILAVVAVAGANTPPTLAAVSNRTITAGVTLTITNAATDPDSPPQVLNFSLGPGAATNATINATNGVFTWTPTQSQVGSNVFGVIVADNGLPSMSATQSFSVRVLASNNPPVLAAISDRTIAEGVTLTITNVATDPDSPPQVLTFSLGPGAAPNATVNATNGVFSWTPTQGEVGSNAFGVVVTDNGLPNLSDAKTFTVNVLARPVLETIAISNNSATLTWSAIPGTTYRLQFKTNLTDTIWGDLIPDVTATGATASTSDPFGTNDMRFYRVLVVPK